MKKRFFLIAVALVMTIGVLAITPQAVSASELDYVTYEQPTPTSDLPPVYPED